MPVLEVLSMYVKAFPLVHKLLIPDYCLLSLRIRGTRGASKSFGQTLSYELTGDFQGSHLGPNISRQLQKAMRFEEFLWENSSQSNSQISWAAVWKGWLCGRMQGPG